MLNIYYINLNAARKGKEGASLEELSNGEEEIVETTEKTEKLIRQG